MRQDVIDRLAGRARDLEQHPDDHRREPSRTPTGANILAMVAHLLRFILGRTGLAAWGSRPAAAGILVFDEQIHPTSGQEPDGSGRTGPAPLQDLFPPSPGPPDMGAGRAACGACSRGRTVGGRPAAQPRDGSGGRWLRRVAVAPRPGPGGIRAAQGRKGTRPVAGQLLQRGRRPQALSTRAVPERSPGRAGPSALPAWGRSGRSGPGAGSPPGEKR
jgi:hypothetical protein